MSMFAKRHYKAIGETVREAIAQAIPVDGHVCSYAGEVAAARLADLFAQDSNRFDRTRFLKACGLGE